VRKKERGAKGSGRIQFCMKDRVLPVRLLPCVGQEGEEGFRFVQFLENPTVHPKEVCGSAGGAAAALCPSRNAERENVGECLAANRTKRRRIPNLEKENYASSESVSPKNAIAALSHGSGAGRKKNEPAVLRRRGTGKART